MQKIFVVVIQITQRYVHLSLILSRNKLHFHRDFLSILTFD